MTNIVSATDTNYPAKAPNRYWFDGAVVARKQGLVKMAPRFDFPIGPHTGVIRIETRLW